jgi:hypothetical protein
MQEKKEDCRVTNLFYIGKCGKSFVHLDPTSLLWKTFQLLLTGDYQTFCGRWPKSGIMQNGHVSPLHSLEHPTEGKGFSLSQLKTKLLPTPTVSQYGSNKAKNSTNKRRSLAGLAKRNMLPTPTASDAWNTRDSRKRFNNPKSKEYNAKKAKNPSCQNLHTAVTKMLPTPTANPNMLITMEAAEKEAERLHPQHRYTLATKISKMLPTPTANDADKMGTGTLDRYIRTGQKYCTGDKRNKDPNQNSKTIGKNSRLNPRFIEEMMGYPIGWTEIEPLE